MARGTDVQGWWAVFPETGETPRRFTSKEDALEFWPEVKGGQYCPEKHVFEVWWEWHDKDLGPERKNQFRRSGALVLTNPLSHEAWREELNALMQAKTEKALEKKRAAKDGPRKTIKKKEGLN